MENNLMIIETTVETTELANQICTALIEQSIAACCQVSGPITSYFSWQNKLCVESEYKISIKTIPQNLELVENTIIKLHPYEVAEIIIHPETRAGAAYGKWVREVCND